MTYDGEFFRAAALHDIAEPLASRLREPFRSAPGDVRERLLQGERLIHIHDIAVLEGRNNPEHRAALDAGVHTLLIVPLRKNDVLLGYITANRRQVRPFTEKQIALLQNFAAQAVIAMENARLMSETREALEQQTATAEVLQVINSSPGDLAPVFDAMVEKAMRLCGAVHGTLTSYDGEHFRCVASHNLPAALFELLRKPRRAAPNSPQERLLHEEPIVHIADMRALPAEDNEVVRAGAEIGFTRTALFVPLRKGKTLLGYIGAQRQEVRPFTDKQIALLQNFAAQAVIAIENARLITETREALEQQTATAEVLQVINSSPGDLRPVFDAILEKAHTLCGAEYGVLLTYDGERFWPVATHGHTLASPNAAREGIRPGFGFGKLVRGDRLLHIHDMAKLAAQMPDDPVPRALVEVSGIRTQLAVPLRKDDKLLGIITANRHEVRPFTDKEMALLENFAAQAVIAMENARLLRELRQRTEEVAELNRDLEARVAEQVEELGRVGRLKRFLAPQLAELIVSQGEENILESHRREIVVVFCDLRGYTAFTETAEPEEVLDFLREYHGALGPLVAEYEGTLDQFSGDGIMVFFNDPVPIPDPAERAARMAMAMREAASKLIRNWRRRGRELGFGAGIAQGYATLGQIGFAERSGYTAIGTVCNLAARLCSEAKDGQILVSQRVAVAIEGMTTLEDVGALALKGLTQPVTAFNISVVRETTATA